MFLCVNKYLFFSSANARIQFWIPVPVFTGINFAWMTMLAGFKLKVLMLACIFIFCFEGITAPYEETLAEYSVRSSVWKISAQEDVNGTGFFIAPNKFVTNFHVVSGLLSIVKTEDIILSQDGSSRTLKINGILAVSALHDLALLETTEAVEHYLLIRQEPLQQQENLFSTGYPGGKLVDIRKTSDSIIFSEDTISFFVNHFSSFGGASGSPVVDEKKQVVGVQYSVSSNLIHSVTLRELQVFVQKGLINKPVNNLEQVIKNEIENLRNLAKQRNAKAQYIIGQMYYQGHEVAQNYAKAEEWFTQAAEQGHAEAQHNLGVMYSEGKGVTQSFEMAVQWFEKAAEQDMTDAQYMLGLMYYKGEGITQNVEISFQWFEKAAEQGHAEAQYMLGLMYYKGEGITQNVEISFQWFEKAAEQDMTDAQYMFGLMYALGFGVTQNFEQAVKLLKQAAEQGHTKAQDALKDINDISN